MGRAKLTLPPIAVYHAKRAAADISGLSYSVISAPRTGHSAQLVRDAIAVALFNMDFRYTDIAYELQFDRQNVYYARARWERDGPTEEQQQIYARTQKIAREALKAPLKQKNRPVSVFAEGPIRLPVKSRVPSREAILSEYDEQRKRQALIRSKEYA